MKSYTRGNFRVATASLRANKWRSFLTTLGIIIGVSSVITVVSIGQGIKDQVGRQINHVGKNLITVRPGDVDTANMHTFSTYTSAPAGGSLGSRDLEAIQRSKGVASALPLGTVAGTVQSERGVYRDGPVVATSSDFPSVMNQSVAYGVFFDAGSDDANMAVLGAHAAQKMFNANVPLGDTVTFRGQDFIVSGILNDFPSTPFSNDVNFNNAIFISYKTATGLTKGSAAFYEILAKPSTADPKTTARAISASLTKLHGDSHDFSVLSSDQVQAQSGGVLNLLTQAITGVAAISLLVGGIGIMNIMLVSVTERMHEVGIRKAVGATNQQILSEFMAEAAVLCLIGAIIGILLSLVINLILRILTSLTPVVDWKVILLASGVAIAVGILFGTAPALKAARKDPIAALRNE
jgi:putative ABC transport system permease protein